MYRKKDSATAALNPRSHARSPIDVQNEDINLDATDLFYGRVTQALLLYKPPADGMLNQQALLAHALDADLAYNTPTLGVLACSISGSLENSCLRASFLACYAGWLGRRDHSRRLVDAGHEFYTQALKDTHHALVTPKTAHDVSTLAACSALGIYEALECPGGTKAAYLWHRDACDRLIRLRGPESHQTGPAHRLFVNFRFFGVRNMSFALEAFH